MIHPALRCLAAALAFSSLSCFAAPPTDESVRRLFQVMKAESLIDSVYATMEPMMRQSMAQGLAQANQGKAPTPAQQAVLDRAPQRLSAVLRSELSWAKMEPLQISIYRESFDQAEIDGLIAFYSSPAGQAFVNKMPVVTQKAMASMQTTMQQVMPKIQAAMQEVLAEAQRASGQ